MKGDIESGATRLTDYDLHLFNEGRHYRLYTRLGAHPVKTGGCEGVNFAVWAPNALEVSVTGEFCDWRVESYPMNKQFDGTWELQLPRSLPAYLRGEWRQPGHNPLGSLSVLAMLAVLGAQTVTGLLAYDDIAFRGPLTRLVSTDTSLWLTDIHRLLKNLLMLLIVLHVVSIVAYQLRGKKLLQAMLHGRDEQMKPEQAARDGDRVALLFTLILSVAAIWALQQAPQWLEPPKPATPPPVLSW